MERSTERSQKAIPKDPYIETLGVFMAHLKTMGIGQDMKILSVVNAIKSKLDKEILPLQKELERMSMSDEQDERTDMLISLIQSDPTSSMLSDVNTRLDVITSGKKGFKESCIDTIKSLVNTAKIYHTKQPENKLEELKSQRDILINEASRALIAALANAPRKIVDQSLREHRSNLQSMVQAQTLTERAEKAANIRIIDNTGENKVTKKTEERLVAAGGVIVNIRNAIQPISDFIKFARENPDKVKPEEIQAVLDKVEFSLNKISDAAVDGERKYPKIEENTFFKAFAKLKDDLQDIMPQPKADFSDDSRSSYTI